MKNQILYEIRFVTGDTEEWWYYRIDTTTAFAFAVDQMVLDIAKHKGVFLAFVFTAVVRLAVYDCTSRWEI